MTKPERPSKGRPLTTRGARLRDLILARPELTYPEVCAVLASEGHEAVSRSVFVYTRRVLREEGHAVPMLPRGAHSQSRHRPKPKRSRAPVAYPRDERERCPTCGQLVRLRHA